MAKKKKKNALNAQGQLLLVVLVICGVLFAPTTILLLFGMLPTIVAGFTDRSEEKVRGITVGCMNLAGCFPFLLELWTTEHDIARSIEILSGASTWVVMYAAAGVGYCMEWAMAGAASIYMTEMAQNRLKAIDKQQEQLVERWGKEVTGDIPLDPQGFPLPNSMVSKNKPLPEPAENNDN
jgi:hypothetical protein